MADKCASAHTTLPIICSGRDSVAADAAHAILAAYIHIAMLYIAYLSQVSRVDRTMARSASDAYAFSSRYFNERFKTLDEISIPVTYISSRMPDMSVPFRCTEALISGIASPFHSCRFRFRYFYPTFSSLVLYAP